LEYFRHKVSHLKVPFKSDTFSPVAQLLSLWLQNRLKIASCSGIDLVEYLLWD